jgi:hypothetical protein
MRTICPVFAALMRHALPCRTCCIVVLQAAVNYNSTRMFVWRLLRNVSIGEGGQRTCNFPGYIAAQTHLFGQVLPDYRQQPTNDDESGLNPAKPAPDPAAAGSLEADTPPGDHVYSLSFGYVPSAFELPEDAQDKFMQVWGQFLPVWIRIYCLSTACLFLVVASTVLGQHGLVCSHSRQHAAVLKLLFWVLQVCSNSAVHQQGLWGALSELYVSVCRFLLLRCDCIRCADPECDTEAAAAATVRREPVGAPAAATPGLVHASRSVDCPAMALAQVSAIMSGSASLILCCMLAEFGTSTISHAFSLPAECV